MSDHLMTPIQCKSIYNNPRLKWKTKPSAYVRNHSIIFAERTSVIQDQIDKIEERRIQKFRKAPRPNSAAPSISRGAGYSQRSESEKDENIIRVLRPERSQPMIVTADKDCYYQNNNLQSPDQRHNRPSSAAVSRSSVGRKRPMTSHAQGGRNLYTSQALRSSKVSRDTRGVVFDCNPTYEDIDQISDRTNKLKLTIHGKRFGNYVNRPLSAMDKRAHLIANNGGSKRLEDPLKEYHDNRKFMDTLYRDSRTNAPSKVANNLMINSILGERKTILRDRRMFEGLLALKRKDLLKHKTEKVKAINPGVVKEFIFTGEHDKRTNIGYSRNVLGTFFYH